METMGKTKTRTGTEWATWQDSIARVPKPGDTVYGIDAGYPAAYQITETHNPSGFFVCGAIALPDGDARTFFDAADMYLYHQWHFNRDTAMAELRGRV